MAGVIGQRIEPLVGSLILLLVLAVPTVLHPERQDFLRFGGSASRRLMVICLLAAVPAAWYAARMLAAALDAGPSCFLGRCAAGDRLAEMAAAAATVVLVGFLAALQTRGWRLPLWSAGTAAVLIGLTSVALPAVPGSFGRLGGVAAAVWGVLLVAIGEQQHRRARGSGAGT
jgi:hypothetical protein